MRFPWSPQGHSYDTDAIFNRIKFDCEISSCSSNGQYKLQGVAVGVKLSPARDGRLHPYVKGGVTFNSLEGAYGGGTSTSLTTDRAPGYEVGVGATAPATKSDAINYATFDLGLSFATPFGGRR